MVQNLAIVLKSNFPINQRVTIFDKTLGKIEASVLRKDIILSNGMLFSYNFSQNNTFQIIKDIYFIEMPCIEKSNLMFFHNVLELCNYFLPFGISFYELFDYLNFLYISFDKIQTLQVQKIFLSKFFLILGFYPEINTSSTFDYIMYLPIDRAVNETINLTIEKELNTWIINCINMHPHIRAFKTFKFLNEIAIT